MKSKKKPIPKTPKKASATRKKPKGFTAEEKAAIREYVSETRGRRGGKADGEQEVLTRIAKMPQPDRSLAERFHTIVKANAPGLSPKTWYGMPAYAKDDKVVCYFQDARKFKTRYATLGFSDKAALDDGRLWPTAFALMELGATEEATIVALLKKATS